MSELRKPPCRVVLCRGEFCNLGRRADTLYPRLREAIDEINAGYAQPLIGLRTANCLSMCGNGPNMVIYPEDRVFNRLDLEALQVVIDDYLRSAAASLDAGE